MYFIALVAPEEINRRVLKWKLWMQKNFECVAALRSPGHITLISPFWMQPTLEGDLSNAIDQFALTTHSFNLQLNNFSHFGNKVIFIDVVPHDQLTKLPSELFDYLSRGSRFPIKKEERIFHPHVSIAFRDLYKKGFVEAWEYFKEKKYSFEWLVNNISLLRHNGINWEVVSLHYFQSMK